MYRLTNLLIRVRKGTSPVFLTLNPEGILTSSCSRFLLNFRFRSQTGLQLQNVSLTHFSQALCPVPRGLVVLPKLTPEGRRVIVFSHLNTSSEDFDANVMLKRISMMMDILLQEGVDYIGLDVIVDSRNVVFGHLARYNLNVLRKTFDLGWVSSRLE